MLVRSLFRTCRSPNQQPRDGKFKNPLRRVFVWLKYVMPTFITPYSGNAELTASNGLDIIHLARWQFNKFSYADGATFGVTIAFPNRDLNGPYYDANANPPPPGPLESGELHVRGQNWTIADIGNSLTAYTDPDTAITYPATKCRILVTGYWRIVRAQINASYNSFGVRYAGWTYTDQGEREMEAGALQTYTNSPVTYVIQGSGVDGGAQDTFSPHVWFAKITESASSVNSNRAFASNTFARPVWYYAYSKSWQTT